MRRRSRQAKIGALCAVKGVEFIDDDIAQGVGLIVAPELLRFGLHQQIVQHFVVGEQQVGGRVADDLLVCDDFVWPHGRAGAVVFVADVESSGDFVIEARGAVDEFGDAFGLVGGQSIHWIYQDGFDALTIGGARLLAAVF